MDVKGQLMPASERSYVSTHFALQVGTENSGFLKSVEGGSATAEVVTEPAGPSPYSKKHLGPVSYEPIAMQIDLNLAKSVYEWIDATWMGNSQPKSGSIAILDAQYKVVQEQQFSDARITEVTIPALDGSSKDAAYLTVKLAPEMTHFKKGDGASFAKPLQARSQKRWLICNFRLGIDGIDCQKVSKIDSFTIRSMDADNSVGEMRDYQKVPGKIEFPNLAVTMSENGAQSWFDWHEDFVIKGNCGDEQEKNGTLSFLAPDAKTELARINFFNLGIFKLTPVKNTNLADQVRRVAAELYCERMEFKFS